MQPNLRGTDVEYSERVALRHEKLRYNVDVIQAYIDACYGLDASLISSEKSKKRYTNRSSNKDFQLKFVVGSKNDIVEIENKYLRLLQGVNPEDVVLMPIGLNQEQLKTTTMLALRACIQHGWRYTPRLHIDMFNDKRSV
jgi:7-carboxy-7-deazaguanine synthase